MRAYLLHLSVQHDAVFSQLAVPIAVVLWLYITAFSVLLGAEFNAEIEKMWPNEEHPWRLRRLGRIALCGIRLEQQTVGETTSGGRTMDRLRPDRIMAIGAGYCGSKVLLSAVGHIRINNHIRISAPTKPNPSPGAPGHRG